MCRLEAFLLRVGSVFSRSDGLASNVDGAVTFLELRRAFEFLGTNSMPVNDADWYPRGVFLAVVISDVSTFVEQFQHLTRADLRRYNQRVRPSVSSSF